MHVAFSQVLVFDDVFPDDPVTGKVVHPFAGAFQFGDLTCVEETEHD